MCVCEFAERGMVGGGGVQGRYGQVGSSMRGMANLPSPPAVSVLDVPASQASSGVYVRPRLTSSAAVRRACARRARQKSQCDFCRRTHAATHAGRLAKDTFEAHAVLRVHV